MCIQPARDFNSKRLQNIFSSNTIIFRWNIYGFWNTFSLIASYYKNIISEIITFCFLIYFLLLWKEALALDQVKACSYTCLLGREKESMVWAIFYCLLDVLAGICTEKHTQESNASISMRNIGNDLTCCATMASLQYKICKNRRCVKKEW